MVKLLNIISNLSKERKSAFVFVFATAISSGLNIFMTPVFTRLMTQEEFGVVSLYNSWYSIIGVFATFSVTNTVVYIGFHNYKDDKLGFCSSLLGVSSLFSFITSIIYVIFKNRILLILGISNSLVIIMIYSFIFLPAVQIWLCLQRYTYKYKKAFWLISLTAIISTICSVFIGYNAKSFIAEYRIISMNLIPIFSGFFLYFYICIKGKKIFNFNYWKFIISFNTPLILHYLSQYILQSSDKIMIGVYYSKSEVAIYSIAYSISNIILVFWAPINSVLISYTHDCVDNNKTENLSKTIYRILIISSFICVIVSFLSPELILLFSTKSYLSGVYAIPPITLSTLFFVLFNIIANIEFMYGKTYRIAIFTIIAAVLNIILNIILIPRFGFVAAAYTTLISYGVYSYLHYYNMIKLHRNKIFSELKILLIVLFTIIISLGSLLLYEYQLIRFFLIVVFIIVGCLYLKKIKLFNH